MEVEYRKPLNVLLVGGGGRESALAWKLAQSPIVNSVHVTPGNGGTDQVDSVVSNVREAAVDDYEGLVRLAKRLNIGLVVAGTDQAVVDGIGDYFEGCKSWLNLACAQLGANASTSR